MPDLPQPLLALSGASLLAAAVMVAVFVGALFVGSIIVPGRRVKGPELGGKTITYRLNGLALLLLTLLAAGVAQFSGLFSLSSLYKHVFALFVVANVFAFAFAGWLYWRATRGAAEPPGFWSGYFVGVELNPGWLGVDLKMFSYRPSLIGLGLLNASFAAVQYETYGHLTLGMALYQVLTWGYLLSYFLFEAGMLHTWDIIRERFGWALVWGDYVLVPFFYSIIGWWLVDASGPPLSPAAAAAILLLYAFGFWVFRGANGQKHRFKRDPSALIWGKPAETLDGRLLVSGFWGIGRHLNYTGEICIYLSFALTAGFSSWAPFVLPAWLAGLLLHRSRRDERRCSAKYGELWARYKKRVRWAMLPFVY